MLILLYSLLHNSRILLLDVMLLDFALKLVSWNDSSSLLSPDIELIRGSFIFSSLFRLPAWISPRNGTWSCVEVWNILKRIDKNCCGGNICELPSHGYCQTSHLHKPAAEVLLVVVDADEVDELVEDHPCEVVVLDGGNLVVEVLRFGSEG